MKHLDLFSGIGGFSLASQWVWGKDHNIHSFVEIDPFCQKVLKKHWPKVPILSDIKEYKHDGTKIDLLTGGFPCQPFSCAGKQRGTEDDRYLWPEMLRVISEVHPTWIIGENVAGIINMGLDQVLSDLENTGYTCQSFIIPACSMEASHKRYRIWIIANSKGFRWRNQGEYEIRNTSKAITNGGYKLKPLDSKELRKLGIATTLREANGIPNRVDRLKSLGNAIVPQVVVPIMQAIKETDQ